MAKNDVKSSFSKNNSNKNNSSAHKNIFIICAAIVIVLLVGLWIFSIKEKLPTILTQGTPSQLAQGTLSQEGLVPPPSQEASKASSESESVGLAGKAISGIAEQGNIISSQSLSAGTAAINPESGVVVIDSATETGETFTVDVVAKGNVAGVNENSDCKLYSSTSFEVTIKYQSNVFSFIDAKVLLQGWSVKVDTIAPDTKKITAETSSLDDAFCYLKYSELLELSFTPNKVGYSLYPTLEGGADIELFSVVIKNDKGPIGNTLQVINQYYSSTFAFKKRYYLDDDLDGYAGQNNQLFAYTDTKPSNYISKKGDCDDIPTDDKSECNPASAVNCNNPETYSQCAKCINPSVLNDACDGVDNNCNGGITDEVVPEICKSNTFASGKECGVYYVCQNSRIIDCNNPNNVMSNPSTWTSFSSDTDKCGQGFTCVGGQCTTITQTQDCTQFENQLTACQTSSQTCTGDLTTCNTNLQNCLNSQGGCILWDTDFVDTDTADAALAALTPACGDNVCQAFEHYLTCPQDCNQADICDPTKQNGNANYCLIDSDNNGASDNDDDQDGLANAYENYLNVNAGLFGIIWFSNIKADTDNDGIKDSKDYCPNTDTKGSKLTIASGHINFNGCYAGDVGQQNADVKRPDGCFSAKDTTFLINYYTSLVKGEICNNLYGEQIG